MNKEVCRILVIEDNPGDVLLIQETLRACGIHHEMTHYDTADRAVRAVKQYREDGPDVPDVMLLDYNIPAGEARDVLTAVQSNPALQNMRKAVVTSSLAPKDREQAISCGAEYFIYKPVDLDSFITEVGQTLQLLCGDGLNGSNCKTG